MRCKAQTKRGTRCTFKALASGAFCGRHRRTHEATAEKDWRSAFLDAFAEMGLVLTAAKKAGVARSTVYRERQRNEDFALRWAEVEEWTTEEMEQEARRRAVLGVAEPVYQRGELVGHVRKFSDTLLIFLLKARRPEMYRENRLELTGADGGPIAHAVDLSRLSEEELREYRRLTELASEH
ncbi:MAG: terminase [Longimicrobiaceae bacterium]